MKAAAENGQNGEGATWKKEIAKGLKPDHDKFERVFALKSTGFLVDRKRAGSRKGGEKIAIGRDFPHCRTKSQRMTRNFCRAPMADSQNHHPSGKPASVAPKRVGLGVEIEVHPKVDMGNDRIAKVVSNLFNGRYFFQSL